MKIKTLFAAVMFAAALFCAGEARAQWSPVEMAKMVLEEMNTNSVKKQMLADGTFDEFIVDPNAREGTVVVLQFKLASPETDFSAMGAEEKAAFMDNIAKTYIIDPYIEEGLGSKARERYRKNGVKYKILVSDKKGNKESRIVEF